MQYHIATWNPIDKCDLTRAKRRIMLLNEEGVESYLPIWSVSIDMNATQRRILPLIYVRNCALFLQNYIETNIKHPTLDLRDSLLTFLLHYLLFILNLCNASHFLCLYECNLISIRKRTSIKTKRSYQLDIKLIYVSILIRQIPKQASSSTQTVEFTEK